MVRRRRWRRWRCPERRGRPLSCVFVADAGSWAVLSAMRAAVTVMWVVRTAAWAAGTAAWAAGWCFGDGLTFPSPTMAGTSGPYHLCYGAEGGGELGAQHAGGGGRLGERFQSLRVQHLAADWVDQQPVGGQEI